MTKDKKPRWFNQAEADKPLIECPSAPNGFHAWTLKACCVYCGTTLRQLSESRQGTEKQGES